jgi:hypothetical protein
MPNPTANLPLPVLNGPGATVNTSTMGAAKTFIVTGSFQGATIIVEASTDGGSVFAPVAVFGTGDRNVQINVVADHMRARVTGRKTSVPFAATVEVGAPADTPLFADLPTPVLNGPGTSVDISTFPDFSTFIAGGSFGGANVAVEISDDNVDFAPLVTFSGKAALQSRTVTANWARVNVSGRKTSIPFSATFSMGSSALSGGGGGGGGGVIVELSEVVVTNPATTLDFQRPGMFAEDQGGGTAKIWATLLPVVNAGPPEIEGGNLPTFAGETNRLQAPNGAVAVLPLAGDNIDGTPLIVKLVGETNGDGATSGPITFATQGGDTIDLYPTPTFPTSLNVVGQAIMFVTNGVDDWNMVGFVDVAPTVPTEQRFRIAVDHTTNPGGIAFAIAYPTDFAVADAANLVFAWMLQPPTVDDIVDLVLLSYDESGAMLAATSVFADGTIIHLTVSVKTGGA